MPEKRRRGGFLSLFFSPLPLLPHAVIIAAKLNILRKTVGFRDVGVPFIFITIFFFFLIYILPGSPVHFGILIQKVKNTTHR